VKKRQRKYLILPLIFIGVNLSLYIYVAMRVCFSFKYPYVSNWWDLIVWSLFCTLPTILAIIYLPLKRWFRKWMRIVGAAILLAIFPFSFMGIGLTGFICPFSSQTSDINHYLIADDYPEKYGKSNIFPQEIPQSARNVEYFYRFRNSIEADFDIYLKIELSEPDFTAELTRIQTQFPDAQMVENEDGTIEYRIRYHEDPGYYSYEFVTFSLMDLTATYIEAYTIDDGEGAVLPYFKEILY